MPEGSSIAAPGVLGWRRSLTRRRFSEAALVRAAQRGSKDAVEELFARHWPGAHRTATLVTGDRAAGEDIAQEAFLAAVSALPRFDARRPLGPWLHRIVVNRAIDFARARALRMEVGDVPGETTVAAEERSSPGEEISQALMRLPVDQRAVVVLRYVLDLTPGEIAAALDLARGTVNSRLRRGLDALGELVGETAP